MLLGYARVSTLEQNLELQLDALKAAGCERIWQDQASGAQADRPGLTELLSHLRAGDVLVVWKLDRLGRHLEALLGFVRELETAGAHLRSITDQIDTSTPVGRFVFHLFGALAEMERGLIRERTHAGLAAARLRGRIGGRRPKMTPGKQKAAANLLQQMSAGDVAEQLGVSRATVYRHKKGKG